MAGYKEIKGFQVQTRSEDPVPFAQEIENNPYQGSWSSGGTANTARNNLFGVGESTSAVLIYAGESPVKANTESYNGSSWTELADLNTARQNGGSIGTNTSAGAGLLAAINSVIICFKINYGRVSIISC